MEIDTPSQQAASSKCACPVCEKTALIYDVVDLNKSCSESWGAHLRLTGIPIYYHRCISCGFTFAAEFQDWPSERFLSQIYNDDYINVDPDYISKRPLSNADFVGKLFNDQRSVIRHLDYGGGNGLLSAKLGELGWDSRTYDPFPSNDLELSSLGKFNLITAFEVFEHVPDVRDLMSNLTSLMDEECVVIFSTLLSDDYIQSKGRLNWWYASPRNGHISLFSKKSLVELANLHGLEFGSFNTGLHCFFNRLPDWAAKLMGQQ
jgi:hypothetical protein